MVELAEEGILVPCVSDDVWAEYRDVLFREKFAALRAVAERLMETIHVRAVVVHPASRLSVATDDDDNRFLECAQAAEARWLITGNRKHYPPEWGVTRVVNAREFLEDYSPSRPQP